MTDRRSAAAKARDEWFESTEGLKACDASTLGTANANYYLRNRLMRAFLAGMEADRRLRSSAEAIKAAAGFIAGTKA